MHSFLHCRGKVGTRITTKGGGAKSRGWRVWWSFLPTLWPVPPDPRPRPDAFGQAPANKVPKSPAKRRHTSRDFPGTAGTRRFVHLPGSDPGSGGVRGCQAWCGYAATGKRIRLLHEPGANSGNVYKRILQVVPLTTQTPVSHPRQAKFTKVSPKISQVNVSSVHDHVFASKCRKAERISSCNLFSYWIGSRLIIQPGTKDFISQTRKVSWYLALPPPPPPSPPPVVM